MPVHICPVISRIDISHSLFVLKVLWQGSITPGQFFMIQIPDSGYILPRPFSAFEVDIEQNTLSFLIRIRGAGSRFLSQLKSGNQLKLFGSLGKGFQTDIRNKMIVCISGSEGIAPFWQVISLLHKENKIILLAGFRDQYDAEILTYFQPYQNNVDIRYTINPQPVTDLLADIIEPDFLYVCGPIPMMQAVCNLTKSWQNTHTLVSLENKMACGTGACMGCTWLKDKSALKVCSQGPVFEAHEVFDDA